MISPQVMNRCLGRISLLKFFPAGNEHALAAIAEMIAAEYSHDDDAVDAVNEILKHHSEWPGPGAFRSVLRSAIYEFGVTRDSSGRRVHKPNPNLWQQPADWVRDDEEAA